MPAQDAVVAIIVALFMAGGPVVVWIQTRAANRKELTPQQAEETMAVKVAENIGIADRWMNYADGIESRLSERIDELEKTVSEERRSKDKAISYINDLRSHIHRHDPPPPPPWPPGID